MSQAAVAKVVSQRCIDRLVLTEDHPPKKRPVRRRHPRHHGPLGPFTHAVEPPRKAAAPPPGAPSMLE
jgi:hypothetical protein